MAIPDFQSLMLPILRRLGERAWATGEMVEAMAEQHHLTEQERRALLPSGDSAPSPIEFIGRSRI